MGKRLSELIEEDKLIDWKRSGDLVLDEMIGAGMPFSRVIEIFGKDSSGKTTLSLYIMGLLQKRHDALLLYVDSEGSAENIKTVQYIDPENTIYSDTMIIEEVFEEIDAFIEKYKGGKQPLIVLWDSLATCNTMSQFENPTATNEYAGSVRAQVVSKCFTRGTLTSMRANKVFMIIVNQTRTSMDKYGEKEYVPGGRFVKHLYSVRIHMTRREADALMEGHRRVGITPIMTIKKTKLSSREKQWVSIPLYFDDRCISNTQNILEFLIDKGKIKAPTDKTKNKTFDFLAKVASIEKGFTFCSRGEFDDLYEKNKKEINILVKDIMS